MLHSLKLMTMPLLFSVILSMKPLNCSENLVLTLTSDCCLRACFASVCIRFITWLSWDCSSPKMFSGENMSISWFDMLTWFSCRVVRMVVRFGLCWTSCVFERLRTDMLCLVISCEVGLWLPKVWENDTDCISYVLLRMSSAGSVLVDCVAGCFL